MDVKNEFDERKIRIVGKKVEFLRSTFLNKVRLRGTSPIFRTNLVHPMLLSRNKKYCENAKKKNGNFF